MDRKGEASGWMSMSTKPLYFCGRLALVLTPDARADAEYLCQPSAPKVQNHVADSTCPYVIRGGRVCVGPPVRQCLE